MSENSIFEILIFFKFLKFVGKMLLLVILSKISKKKATATIITQKIPNWVIITFKIGLVVTTATFEHFLSVFDHWLARGKQTNLWQNVVSEMKKMGTKSIGTYMASPEYHNFFVKMC
jgi:hypothetical protein